MQLNPIQLAGCLLAAALALAAAQATAAAAAAEHPKLPMYTSYDFCHAAIRKLEAWSQIQHLASVYEPRGSASCDRKQKSLLPVRTIGHQNAAGRLCRQLVGLQMAAAKHRRLDLALGVPAALSSFEAALGFEISAVCKLNALSHLQRLDELLEQWPRFRARLERAEQAGAFVLSAETCPASVDPIRLAAELVLRIRRAKARAGSKEHFEGPQAGLEFARSFAGVCSDGLRELMRDLFDTLVSLAADGLDYALDGELIEAAQARAQLGPGNGRLLRWLNVLISCEALTDVDQFGREPDDQPEVELSGVDLRSGSSPGDLLRVSQPAGVAEAELREAAGAKQALDALEQIRQRLPAAKAVSLRRPSSRLWRAIVGQLVAAKMTH